MQRLLDGRKWIVLALLVVVSIVAIPTQSAQASAWLPMWQAKSKALKAERYVARKTDGWGSYVDSCDRVSRSVVECLTGSEYEDMTCLVTYRVRKYSSGYVFPRSLRDTDCF